MTDIASDFDAEKRRRWYAASLGVVGATTLIGLFSIKMYLEGIMKSSGDSFWEIALSLFGFWVFFFVLKYVAAYALWYKPYASRKRAIGLSLCATLAVYLALTGGGVLFTALNGTSFDFIGIVKMFWKFHLMIYALPYFAAAIVGWSFARSAPDVRESF